MFPLFLWAQAPVPNFIAWLLVLGEPTKSISGPLGGILTWAKVVGLFCLLGWVGAKLVAASAQSFQPRARQGSTLSPLNVAALLALLGAFASLAFQVFASTRRTPLPTIATFTPPALLAVICAVVILVWVEVRLWSGLRRLGVKNDLLLLGGLHVALALGFVAALAAQYANGVARDLRTTVFLGSRWGATYMGLVVLAWAFYEIGKEVICVRPRRLYAIGWQCWIESFRRMGAPWALLVVFGVILAFFDWFSQPSLAEMGRSYVSSLTFLIAVLIMVMITILVPISLPNDIRQQTIYTVVSKPTRRLELVWGRMLGYMALVTVLLAIFGAVSLLYLDRNVGGAIRQARAEANRAAKQNRADFAKHKNEEADQLQSRLAARVPIYGMLSYFDSRGVYRKKGIDVGQELERRSFIEGATPSKAVWNFGLLRDPANPRRAVDLRIPIDQLLAAGTIEAIHNQIAEQSYDQSSAEQERSNPKLGASESNRLASKASAAKAEIERLTKELASLVDREKKLLDRAREARAAKQAGEAQGLRDEAAALHSRDVPVEMSFNVYRTTKGEVGEPVYATLVVKNPRPDVPHVDRNKPYSAIMAIHEYYTDKRYVPARHFVGSRGAISIEVQCSSPNQYLGMAESDLYVLADQGGFRANFVKGLLGVWLQAMVLTAIGVWAGTFLSWPVAFLTTLFFSIVGFVGFSFLSNFALRMTIGGGPFESMIRVISHDNLQSELAPTIGVIAAKTFDAIVMPIMERLAYLVPNFSALDVSNIVADGFAVTSGQVMSNILLGLGYALPFSIAAYFILKNREVAA
jgi:hypothetical protein